jgi:hypothetical protein
VNESTLKAFFSTVLPLIEMLLLVFSLAPSPGQMDGEGTQGSAEIQ